MQHPLFVRALAEPVAAARSAVAGADIARRAVGLLDLTRLEDDDDDPAVATSCRAALTPVGPVAAVCVFPRFVPLARRTLSDQPVRIATVVNFPDGAARPAEIAEEARTALAAGADEVDMVFPYRAVLAGDRAAGAAAVTAARAACGPDAVLKVIVESGAVPDPDMLADMAVQAIEAGADFLKTSTGKIAAGASLEAAAVLLAAARDAARTGRTVGVKVSGGVRTADQAAQYMALADRIAGPGFVRPATVRIGASTLLRHLLERAGITVP